ncbi:FMN-dependent NADH-azoreductase [Primorskyibacter sp. S187A]|uniref:FMN-dependent NADH-azoreductase n=1 Tax=Primorskyibacter sp. S187A TaxID=3415130 RepID=UPI003C7BB3E2
MTETLLKIDASARMQGSVTRQMTMDIVEQLQPANTLNRDLAEAPLPQLSETWVTANFTPSDARTQAQRDVLALSDALIEELTQAETIVIGLPIYNFGVPTALKAWIDLVARAGVTFRYSENGPVGLLEGKRAIIAVASGGTPVDSQIDFATPYLRHALGFIGITDVTVIAADALGQGAEEKQAAAQEAIAALAA